MADTVQGLLKRKGKFSRRMLTEAFRLEKIRKHFLPLVAQDEISSTLGKVVGGVESGGFGASGSWTIPFWIYLTEEPTNQMRNIFFRGLDSEATRQVSQPSTTPPMKMLNYFI